MMRSKANSGFTLLEMMIAFVILSIAVTSIYKSLTTGLTTVNERFIRYEATEIALSVITELAVTRPQGHARGDIGDIWHWEAKSAPPTPPEFLPPNIRFSRLSVQVFRRGTLAATLSRILSAEVP